ncbi:hypothetical protein HW561_21020 [Rhodobacteraceae bacterium B1Z28]|uniref:Uncharacterized protein n=1 Tax=Ruegeria haliotis TaxID=2747601 RepID=A0ABX2PVQ2_9RHOB|nr:hypothetical protein [Ruegeria haliotis]NVO58272.1 hypothetical protein [Ruegeria haliotis]
MSVLGRLTELASGRAQARLRPRLPTRFEPGGYAEDGFVTRDQEIAASAPNSDRRESALDSPAQPQRKPQKQREQRATDASRPIPSRPQPDPPASRRELGPLPIPESVTSETVQNPPHLSNQPTRPAQEKPDQPMPQIIEQTAETDGIIHHHHYDTLPPADTPPDPLLPPVENPKFNLTAQILPEPRGERPDRVAAGASGPSAPPEITIHIGRIDLRTPQPEKPRRPKPKGPKAPVASLSDYLKGGSS